MKTREITLKTVLWAIVGVLAVVTVVRFTRGLGATTALSDAAPWGFWIAFDVMAGVALAAGGFVLAATVYIFGRREYRAFARPAILTAFLGYTAVAVGLLYDLGLPWRIWHPIVYPQHHSVLFEVAMCVILYLAVLLFEFSPVILEHRLFQRPIFQVIHRVLKRVSIPLVISGIVLSTLHQSSLGSLFLIAPYRLHALWYSPIIWVLFLISAVGLGLMMVTGESFFSSWVFGHRLRMGQLSGLGKAASVVLFVYLALRLGDLAVRGVLPQAFNGSWQSYLFLFEISTSALIPAALLLSEKVRTSPVGLAMCSGLTVFGMIGYRFDTCVVAFARPEGMSYFPSWMEISVSLGIVAAAMLVFMFFVEKLRVYPEEQHEATEVAPAGAGAMPFEPLTLRTLLPDRVANPRRYSLAAVTGAALALALIPQGALFGSLLKATPVSATRTISGLTGERPDGSGHEFSVMDPTERIPGPADSTPLMMLDGNRDGRLVLFPHDSHIANLGGRDSCGKCHHRNMPFDSNTSCHECHRDMYVVSDIFSHTLHVDKLEDNKSCKRCHHDAAEVKTRHSAEVCTNCHADMIVSGSIIQEPEGGMRGYAAGYMDAMHGLCIACHRQKVEEDQGGFSSSFDKCENCHRDSDIFRPQLMGPYITERLEQ